MYKLIDFGNVWGIGFAINSIFVFFELSNFLNDYFEKHVINLGSEELDHFFVDKDKHYILKKSIFRFQIRYDAWMFRLKLLSMLNTALSLFILIYCGFNPSAQAGFIFIIFILFLIFTPILTIPFIILYILPYYRIKEYKNNISYIINDNDKLSKDEKEKFKENYYTVVDLIKLRFTLPNHPIYKDDFMNRLLQLSKSGLNKKQNDQQKSSNKEE